MTNGSPGRSGPRGVEASAPRANPRPKLSTPPRLRFPPSDATPATPNRGQILLPRVAVAPLMDRALISVRVRQVPDNGSGNRRHAHLGGDSSLTVSVRTIPLRGHFAFAVSEAPILPARQACFQGRVHILATIPALEPQVPSNPRRS